MPALAVPSRPAGPARPWSVTVGLVAAVAVACAALLGPLWRTDPATALFTLLLSVMLAGAGLVLWPDAGQRPTADLLVWAGLLWSLGWVEEWNKTGPYPVVAALATPVAASLAAWAMLRYPSPTLMRCCERTFLSVLTVWLVGSQFVYNVTERPEHSRYSPHAWWLTVVVLTDGQHERLALVQQLGEVVAAVLFLVVWVRRVWQVRGLDRPLLVPVAVAAPLVVAGALMLPLAWLLDLPPAEVDVLYAVAPVLLAALPASFLVTVVRARLAGLAVVTMVRQVQRTPTPQAVQQALRRALRDPSLRVSYWASAQAGYVDDQGEPAAGAGDRLRLTVTTDDGQPLALIHAHPDLARHDALVRQAVAAAGLALQNARLQAVVRAQVMQVNESQLRTVEAGLAERRRLERNLHDGAQQRLLALRLRLAAQDDGKLPDDAADLLRGVRTELGLALEELRELARGIYPAVLTRSGLATAVSAVAERQPARVRTQLPERRFPAATEAVAYFVIRAALEHACGPAAATSVTVRGREDGGRLAIEVEDDGIAAAGSGGLEGDGDERAHAASSTGLTAATNRIRALGGSIQLLPAAGGTGSRVVAEIPCG
jgi:signal transduction histidine kinase